MGSVRTFRSMSMRRPWRSRPGIERRAADHHNGNRRVPGKQRKCAAVHSQSRCAHRLQSECNDRMVQQRHGHHQQRHHAGDHHVRCSDHPRTRARRDGPPALHAVDAIRNCHVEGVGERSCHHRRGRGLALCGRAHDPGHSDCRLDPAFHGRGCNLPLLCNSRRDLPGHGYTLDAANGAAVHAGLYADEHAFRQQHAARKHARVAVDRDAGLPIDALRFLHLIDTVPRCRDQHRLAAVSCGRACRGACSSPWRRGASDRLPLRPRKSLQRPIPPASASTAASAIRARAGSDFVSVLAMIDARWFSTVRWLIPRSAAMFLLG